MIPFDVHFHVIMSTKVHQYGKKTTVFFYILCLCMHIILQAFLTKSLFYLLEQKTKEMACEFVGTNLETKLKIKLICEEFFVRKGLKRFVHCFCHMAFEFVGINLEIKLKIKLNCEGFLSEKV